MQRAGHGVDILVNYIFDNYDRVPMEPKHAEQDHNLDASMAYVNLFFVYLKKNLGK